MRQPAWIVTKTFGTHGSRLRGKVQVDTAHVLHHRAEAQARRLREVGIPCRVLEVWFGSQSRMPRAGDWLERAWNNGEEIALAPID